MNKPFPIVVDIWSDVMCPWCAVGYRRFMEGAKLAGDAVDVTVRWMPFELNPDMPAEGVERVPYLARKYDRTREQVEDMQAQMNAAGEEVGFPMEWQGEGEAPPAMMWNTFNAHVLLRWALATHGPAEQTALKEAMLSAHFQRRRKISDRDVLLELVENCGLDREAASAALDNENMQLAVRADEQRGREGGITAVPTFVVNHKYGLQGAQEPENFAAALRKIAEMEEAPAS
ncbi:DsbA family oxidoreductase [Aurantiacibacter gangjinensis]|nr:DsbA family oxidoreductase [Aurantiacibacter gangjinensis]APE28249.1 2-hydroxychromene-2-carboxylate isomerase/DsbA-like thioredoxin domain [Aurantiacibacter gangjinensis]